jgi:hypothetical protein
VAAVDFERAWVVLKAHLATKRSHGADELRVKMSDIEVECLVPESEQGFDLTPAPSRGRESKPSTPAAA